jgi:hypothetical protein
LMIHIVQRRSEQRMRYTLSERTESSGAIVFRDFYVTYNKYWANFLLWALSKIKKNLIIVRY